MNSPSAGDELVVKPGGLLIAAVGFLSTRFLLAEIVYTDGGGALARAVPLAFGLGVALYGVGLAVSTHDREYARTVATWFLVGSGFMTLTTALVTASGMGGPSGASLGSIIATMAIAGGGAGVVVGVRTAAANRSRRTLARQAEQNVLLNRRLRHELLNSLTVIRGHTDMLLDDAPDRERSREAVRSAVERIEETVYSVGFLVRTADDTEAALSPVELDTAVESCRESLPSTVAEWITAPPTVRVRADDNLPTLLTELVSLPGGDADSTTPRVDFDADATSVAITVSAPGDWLDERAREVLVDGVPEYEHNDVDYGIPILRLLVAQYGGTTTVERSDGETAVRVDLLRTGERAPPRDSSGVDTGTLWRSLGIGVVAGVVMGWVLTAGFGSLAVIGALYGAELSVTGWVAHLFHSAVFATVFAVVATKSRLSAYADSPGGTVALGVAWGAILWVVASGVVLSLWLNAIGIPASVPSFEPVSLVGHVVWGAVVAGLWWLLPESVPVPWGAQTEA
ncbi:histidine kinase dimerization/phospho-acceptor domain-containing protein [Halobaculum limi]|uniref:histidine kinase dimerization/phospho-acceptor domain-containing protein n=1 Tax=Halobaculum limi TaxID=3031916 RepID=UPI0024069CF1|nr:histidine kinase dimerization/phospho-acceptor domain-containing protein [Halobaculum sp. YSMS11]